MAYITDFHAHILPGADHGSSSLECSVKQLSLLSRFGIKQVVATPHFYPNQISAQKFVDMRDKCAYKLAAALHKEMPTVFIGAEVLLCPGMDKMPELKKLCVVGTNTILIEMPMANWQDIHFETVYKICKLGYKAVIAHIDRYPPEYVDRLIFETGAVAQINASACQSIKMRKQIKSQLENGNIFALGTDLHGTNKSEIKAFLQFCRWAEDNMNYIFDKTEMLINGAKKLGLSK